jgi:4-hydroxythreonine-4-phosphate dehydrogenase
VKPIAITLGDPAGIGPEVVLKALQRPVGRGVTLFGSRNATEELREKLGLPPLDPSISFVDAGDAVVRIGEPTQQSGRIALDSLQRALGAIDLGECGALVTAPLSKEAVAHSLPSFKGHTELLAAHCGLAKYGRDFAMYFDSPRLRVVLLTVHEPLANALTMLSAELVRDTILLTDREFRRLYDRKPAIGVAAINPHGGESGMFGDEEREIERGVRLARESGSCVASGPHPADTLFLRASRGGFDVVVAAYHDQGLIPVKTLDFEHSVNVTIGLPFLRCSVDHGTAFDIAGRGIADATPMRYAIEWAMKHGDRYEP